MSSDYPVDMSADGPPLAGALDEAALRHRHERSARTAGAVDRLSPLTRSELLDRLTLIARVPERILDVGGGDGDGARALARRYPKARTVLLDHAVARCRLARRRRGWRRRYEVVAGDAQALPFADGAFDMVFANLCLQDCLPPDRALREFRRVLAPGSLLMFATLGPATLQEVRSAWREAQPAEAPRGVHPFVDVHDLGEALGRCGFRDAVLDVDQHRFEFPSSQALLESLRRAGAGGVAADRPRGLTGRARGARFHRALQCSAQGGVVVTAEVVYGHAWATGEPAKLDTAASAGEVSFPLSRLGRR